MWPIQLVFLLFTVCSIFLSSLTLCNTSSYFKRSVQLISILLQHHHISQISRYSLSAHRSVQACHRTACSKIQEDWCPDCTICSQHIVCTAQWDATVTMTDRTLTPALNCKQATHCVFNKTTSKSLTTSTTTNFWRASSVFAFQVRRTRCEDGECTLRRSVGRFLSNCTASQPRYCVVFNVTVHSRQTLPGAPSIRCVLVCFLSVILDYSSRPRIYEPAHNFSTWTRVFWVTVIAHKCKPQDLTAAAKTFSVLHCIFRHCMLSNWRRESLQDEINLNWI